MNIKHSATLLLFSSLIFSCTHKITYKVTDNSKEEIKEHYDIDGKLEANNLENFKLKIIPHFCYVLTREDIGIEINKQTIPTFNYTYKNNELEINNKLIDGDIVITIEEIGLYDNYTITYNASEAESLGYTSITATASSGEHINVEHPAITFTLVAKTNNKVPSNQKIKEGITVSDERFYKQGADISFDRQDEQHVNFTIPSKMLGCNIEVRIPEATV